VIIRRVVRFIATAMLSAVAVSIVIWATLALWFDGPSYLPFDDLRARSNITARAEPPATPRFFQLASGGCQIRPTRRNDDRYQLVMVFALSSSPRRIFAQPEAAFRASAALWTALDNWKLPAERAW